MPEDTMQGKPAAAQFTDAKGRVWSPRVDCRVIAEFEKYLGVGVFEVLFGAMADADSKSDGQPGRCPGTVYADDGEHHDAGAPVGFAEFQSAIGKDEVNAAMLAALNSLFEFFPQLDDDQRGANEEGQPDPFDLFRGETSTNEQASPE